VNWKMSSGLCGVAGQLASSVRRPLVPYEEFQKHGSRGLDGARKTRQAERVLLQIRNAEESEVPSLYVSGRQLRGKSDPGAGNSATAHLRRRLARPAS
jgi:hypothetical protein